jgi:hypothetical protein
MTPDHDLEFGLSVWPVTENLETKNNVTMQITAKLVRITSPPDGPHQLCSIDRQLSNTVPRTKCAAPGEDTENIASR